MEKTSSASTVYRKERSNTGFWLVVLGAALWGVDPLFRIILLKTMTSTQIVLVEHIIVSLIAIPVLWKFRADLKNLRARHWIAVIFISWGGSALATVLFTMALTHNDPNTVLLLQKMQPLFAIVLAKLLLKETLPRRFGGLFFIALLGTYLLTFGFTLPLGNWDNWIHAGSLLSLGAAALWGGSTVMGRLMLGQARYETVTSLRFVVALPLLIFMTWNEGAAWTLPSGTGEQTAVILNILGQALLPGLLSLLLYYKGLSSTKASVATLAELSFPMAGVLVNWIAFRTLITWEQLLGFILIWVALFAISKQQERSSTTADAAPKLRTE
ncbi:MULTISPECIES: DMT family transporter [Paenibacillus]|uniref:Drug/metabolite transporter superfamily protein n=1 Tax=Paenibacillus amylolyticus TaxID=1451 RepID=A0A100VLX0_PAEAM|nr:DMT family transporter [Paenibacillus amylolyticus]GAS82272.1 drug/metabolite transporter superfamily protein [Paenibacillus amylolyticus]